MKFHNPVNISFGSKSRVGLVEEISDQSVLFICTKNTLKRLSNDPYINKILINKDIVFEHEFSSNPSLQDVIKISEKYKNNPYKFIVGLGGGSAIDVAKISSVLIPALNQGFKFEDLDKDPSLFKKIIEIDSILIPTTAGTGSEVTPFATVWDYENKNKKSLSNEKMFAKKTFIDPDFLIDIPIEIALTTALDALNQAFESIWNKNSNEYTRLISRMAIEKSFFAIPNLKKISTDELIRKQLAYASLFAGLSISQTRTSICHSISYPLTMKYDIPHGLACAFSMLEVYKFNERFISDDIKKIRMSCNEDPFQLLKSIFNQYDLKAYFLAKLPKKEKFITGINDFITQGRFENNIRICKKEDLLNILSGSYNELY